MPWWKKKYKGMPVSVCFVLKLNLLSKHLSTNTFQIDWKIKRQSEMTSWCTIFRKEATLCKKFVFHSVTFIVGLKLNKHTFKPKFFLLTNN